MQQCASAIWSGRAYERFLTVVRRQGGDMRVLEDTASYPRPRYAARVISKLDGYVTTFDNRRIGTLAVELGAGRFRVDDRIDPRAGMLFVRKRGEQVREGDVLAEVFTDRGEKLERVTNELSSCIRITAAPPEPDPLIRSLVDASGVHPWSTPDVP
jgi:thymidine phosphorylase